MSVNTSGGPLPEVRDAAANNGISRSVPSTRRPGENLRLRDSVDAASSVNDDQDGDEGIARSTTAGSSNKEAPTKWYQYLGCGMYQDIRNRLPFYVSDWTDAWNYRVVPATLVSSLDTVSHMCIKLSPCPGHFLCERELLHQRSPWRIPHKAFLGSARSGLFSGSDCEYAL